MLNITDVCRCMRQLHPDLQGRVKENTLLVYKQHLDPFLAYVSQKWELQSISAADLDLLVMEYRTEQELTKSQHMQLCAALEFFLPHIKGQVSWCLQEKPKGVVAWNQCHTQSQCATKLHASLLLIMRREAKPDWGQQSLCKWAQD